MNKTSSLIIGFISIVLTSVYAGDPIFTDYKTRVENEDFILLIDNYSLIYPYYYTGSLRLIRKRDEMVLFEKEIGYLTYIWLSPDSKFIVGFSSIERFNWSSGYNLIILNSFGEILHKKSIGYSSEYVKNIKVSDVEDPMSRRLYFYDYRKDPDIKLDCNKLGDVIAISFNDGASERARIPLGKSIPDQNEFKKRTLENSQGSLNEMIQNQALQPTPLDADQSSRTNKAESAEL